MPSFIELSLIALAMSFLYSYKRVLIALPVVVMAIAATYSDPYLGDWAYYLVNASFSAIVVALLQVPKQTLLNVHIQIINAVTVLAHAMGFIMYEIGYPDTYSTLPLLVKTANNSVMSGTVSVPLSTSKLSMLFGATIAILSAERSTFAAVPTFTPVSQMKLFVRSRSVRVVKIAAAQKSVGTGLVKIKELELVSAAAPGLSAPLKM